VTERHLVVTIDTEVDKSPDWSIADPATFRSVVEGIPEVFTPLFDRYGVIPTYLVSPEVLEDGPSVEVLRSLGDRAELGLHLHGEFVDPGRRLHPGTMAGARADAIQRQWSPDVEGRKLAAATELFEQALGSRPTSFRAGRFGLSPNSLELLAGLDYRVDSSVTPGLRWRYPEGELDYRTWNTAPRRFRFNGRSILEVPVSIWPGSRLAPMVDGLPVPAARVARRVLRGKGTFHWLRPSWSGGRELALEVDDRPDRCLVVMLHSMEVIPGASPYATTDAEVRRLVASLEGLLSRARERGMTFLGLTDAAERL
jgi:hypothetical protein